MPRIIKPQKRAALAAGPVLKEHRLGALHVGFQTAQENNARPLTGRQMIGQLAPLRGLEGLRHVHPPR